MMRKLLREWHWHRHRKKLIEIQLLVLDVDGVLTDGGLLLTPDGELQKRFNARDGLGLRLLQQTGLTLAFLSGGQGRAVEQRAQQLGIQHCLIGVNNKPPALMALQEQLQVSVEQTCFVGDDLNDLAVRNHVGLLLTPCDGCRPMRLQADAVLCQRGGHGAVRELAERILQARGHWAALQRHGWRDRND